MTERRAANVCQCGHVFGRLVEVWCAEGLYELIELNGEPYFGIDKPCPVCGRRFIWKRLKLREKL